MSCGGKIVTDPLEFFITLRTEEKELFTITKSIHITRTLGFGGFPGQKQLKRACNFEKGFA